MAKSKARVTEAPFAAPQWPAAQVEMWKLDKIKPYERNARTHSAEQITLLAALMKAHGVDQPIVVDEDGLILKGHGRRLAALEAGFEEFPVAVHRGLSDADKRAMRIADNQVALLSGWDDALLRIEVGELTLSGFDVPLLGFDPGVLKGLMLETATGETNPEYEWDGMPGFDQQNKFGVQRIVVHFADQEAVEKFAALVGQTIGPQTRFIWFPEQSNEIVADKRFKAQDDASAK